MILLSLVLSFLALIAGQVFFPGFPLLVFAPFCVLAIQTKTRGFSLWAAALVGLLYDCLSSSAHFGLFSLCYVLTTLLASLLKRRFFGIHLPLFTVTFSMIYALAHLALFQTFLSPLAFASSFLIMPLVDGLYAFFWHSPALVLYTRFNASPRHRY